MPKSLQEKLLFWTLEIFKLPTEFTEGINSIENFQITDKYFLCRKVKITNGFLPTE